MTNVFGTDAKAKAEELRKQKARRAANKQTDVMAKALKRMMEQPLKGDKGDKGDSIKGDDGKDGIDGQDGKDGSNGKDGKPGKDGRDGKDGKDGIGLMGPSGIDGKNGEDGKDGRGVEKATLENNALTITYSDGEVIEAGRFDFNHVIRMAQAAIVQPVTKPLGALLDVHFTDLQDGEVPVWDATARRWVNDTVAGGMSDLVDDITPQLGGNLDLNGHVITGYGSMVFEDASDYTPTAGLATVATTGAYADLSGTPTVYTQEQIEDFIGGMVSSNTETGIAVTYDDTNGKLDFVVTNATAISNLSGTNTGDQTSVSGNAGTATALQNARTINGTSFNGTADITVTAAAGTLTGTALAANVVTSSLTSVGTLTGLSVAGTGLITSASANALTVGPNGVTNPVFNVDASTASAATGIVVTSAASGSGVTITATGGTNEGLSLASKGSGSLMLTAGSSTGTVQLRPGGSTRANITASQALFSPTTSGTAANVRFSYVAAADTALSNGAEAPAVYFNMGATRQHSSNTTIALQRDYRITGSTHSFATSGGTITLAATMSIDGAPIGGTNATITDSAGLHIPTVALSNVTTGYGAYIVAPSGAGTNYAAFFSGTVLISASNIATDTTTGMKIATGTTQKLGFFDATPVVQQNATGTTTGFTANASANAVFNESTFTGNVGSTAYTISDVVKALKTLGLMAQ